MSHYNKLLTHYWNNYPSLCQREEQFLDHLFFGIGIGYHWENGEIECDWSEEEQKDYARMLGKELKECSKSIVDWAEYQATDDRPGKRIPVDPVEASKWFDQFLETYEIKREVPVFCECLCHSFCEYNLINFPDTINEEWASVVLRVLNWLDSITWLTYLDQNLDVTSTHFRGLDFEKIPGLEWDIKEDPDYVICLELDWSDKEQVEKYRRFEAKHRDIWIKRDKYCRERALEFLEKEYEKIKVIRTEKREKLLSLYPDLEPYPDTILERNTDKPSYYVPAEERTE